MRRTPFTTFTSYNRIPIAAKVGIMTFAFSALFERRFPCTGPAFCLAAPYSNRLTTHIKLSGKDERYAKNLLM